MELVHSGLRPVKSVNPANEEIWLLGQPLLRDYLHYVKETVVGGDKLNPTEVACGERLL
jgi:hypothetical protein